MKYTQKKADELRQKYNINNQTIRNWKFRGVIPDKFGGDYSAPVYDSEKEKKILDLFQIKEKKRSHVLHANHFSVDYKRIYDALRKDRKRGRLDVNFCNSFKKELEEIRKKAKRFIADPSEENFETLRSDQRIAHNVVFKELYTYMQRRYRNPEALMRDHERKRAIELVMVFLKTTAL